jgi:hypothetical protein
VTSGPGARSPHCTPHWRGSGHSFISYEKTHLTEAHQKIEMDFGQFSGALVHEPMSEMSASAQKRKVGSCCWLKKIVEMPRSSDDVRVHFDKIACSDGVHVKFKCNIGACTTVLTMKKEEATSISVLRRHLAYTTHGMTDFLAGGDIPRALEHAEEAERKRARCGLSAFGFKISPAAGFFKLKKKDQRLVTVMLESYDIISHLRTFSKVRDYGQRALKRVMNVPSATEVGCRAMITHWFSEYLDSLRIEWEDVEYIALTSDGRTNYATEHFATVTLHFMLRGFRKMQSRCIACVHERDDRISAEVIARDLDTRLTRTGWPLEKPIVACTTDEGSNFRAVVTRALRTETGRAIIDPDVICMDHMLKTAFEHALRAADGVRDLFERCNKLSSVCRSIKLALHEAQKDLHAQHNHRPFPCSPILPVLTRWGSHYDSAARLLSTGTVLVLCRCLSVAMELG